MLATSANSWFICHSMKMENDTDQEKKHYLLFLLVLQQMKTNEEPFETFLGSEDNLTIDKDIISKLKQRLVT